MRVDPAVIPGLLLLVAELVALAAVGFVVVRVALRQTDDRMALAQGLVVGPALWGLIVNLVMYAVPGLAGVVVGWVVTLALGTGLAWRAPHLIRPGPRVVAGFAVAALALFWGALASRQLLTIPDVRTHLGLAASLRAGEFPPVLPWAPSISAPYHYGFDLLAGLLAPPVGPDLAFVTELLGAYVWMSFALVVVTTLIQRGSWMVALIVAPLLLTAGAWTLVFVTPPHLLHIPVPAGLPSAGLRASLADIYWPAVQLPWSWPAEMEVPAASPPNIFKPFFVLAYALAFVVLERAAARMDERWLRNAALALLVGFLGLTDETVAPIVLALWVALEAGVFWTSRHARVHHRQAAVRAAAGPAIAALLLAVGGGVIASLLTGATGSVLSLGWIDDPGSRQPIGTLTQQPGGVGLLGLGPLVVAGAAALLARRDRLVLALAGGGSAFLLTAFVLQYELAQNDVTRFDGHARNFALLALLLALSVRLASLRPARWRYAAGALIFVLITWPTAVAPVRNLGLAVDHGARFANALPGQIEFKAAPMGRYVLKRFASEHVAAYVRDHTAVDARVLSPSPNAMSLVTGRPNAAGFIGHLHLVPHIGPDYLDALRYLEPAAIRRLGIAYVHATDAWVAELPDRATRWLADPRYFERLIRDDGEALYRVLPEFLRLDAAPAPASFEALRQAVPASATVYLPPVFSTLPRLRVAASLSHARLLGYVDPGPLQLLTPFQVDPLGEHVPDLVVMPLGFVPWMFPPAGRQPIWWNDEVAVYAPDGAVAPIMPPLPPRDASLAVSVRVSDVRVVDGRVIFTATLDDRAPEQWTGQDWVVIAVDTSPWALPLALLPDGRLVDEAWFAGQAASGAGTTTHTYEFDARAARLAVQDGHGVFTAAASGGSVQGSGVWTLGIRLQHEWRPNYRRDAAFIPVLQIRVSEAGEVSYEVYEDPLTVRPLP